MWFKIQSRCFKPKVGFISPKISCCMTNSSGTANVSMEIIQNEDIIRSCEYWGKVKRMVQDGMWMCKTLDWSISEQTKKIESYNSWDLKSGKEN